MVQDIVVGKPVIWAENPKGRKDVVADLKRQHGPGPFDVLALEDGLVTVVLSGSRRQLVKELFQRK